MATVHPLPAQLERAVNQAELGLRWEQTVKLGVTEMPDEADQHLAIALETPTDEAVMLEAAQQNVAINDLATGIELLHKNLKEVRL